MRELGLEMGRRISDYVFVSALGQLWAFRWEREMRYLAVSSSASFAPRLRLEFALESDSRLEGDRLDVSCNQEPRNDKSIGTGRPIKTESRGGANSHRHAAAALLAKWEHHRHASTGHKKYFGIQWFLHET